MNTMNTRKTLKIMRMLMLAAVMCIFLSCTVWASELPVTVEVANDALLDGVAGEDRELIIDLLKMLPASGIFEMLDGTAISMDPDLTQGTISDITGRRELSFTEGYIPKELSDELEISTDKVMITRITRMPDYFEVAFSFTKSGVKTDYVAQMKMKDDNGIMKCVLLKIWKDQTEFVIVEAVSEVFEDYYEEVIEPLY